MCPLCTIAVATGLGVSRWLKIDDTITSLWAGALVAGLTLWTDAFFTQKKWLFPGKILVIALIYFALILIPLYWTSAIGHWSNSLWGIDRFSLGTIIGAVGLAASLVLHQSLRKRVGRSYFPLQRVVLPVGALLLLSGMFYYVTR